VPAIETYGRDLPRAAQAFGNRIETIIERAAAWWVRWRDRGEPCSSQTSECEDVGCVYVDIGKFGGLAETMDESIRYPIRTPRDGDPVAPCVLAGPTCDSADVLYEKKPYELPISLEIGDKVLIDGAGAYTASYASVAFNGFAPLATYHI
jgi:ornithine decarboxylase